MSTAGAEASAVESAGAVVSSCCVGACASVDGSADGGAAADSTSGSAATGAGSSAAVKVMLAFHRHMRETEHRLFVVDKHDIVATLTYVEFRLSDRSL